MIRFSHHDESFLLTKIISQGYVTPKYYPVPKLRTGITVVPINCWKRSLCYKCYPCLFRLCSSSCSFKYEHYAYSVYRIFFIYTAPLIPQQMTLTVLQPSKKKKATVLFAEKEYMYMYVFSDTCKLIMLKNTTRTKLYTQTRFIKHQSDIINTCIRDITHTGRNP